ncbi:MAG: hypothetical protein ACJ786_30280 [Catenulispora sp.]|jgi:hypothetical protein
MFSGDLVLSSTIPQISDCTTVYHSEIFGYGWHMEIPEEAQVAALREVAALGAKRAELLSQAADVLKELEPAAIRAVKTGAQRARVRELAQVSTGTMYGWLETAGLEVRPKRSAKRDPE